MSAAEQVGIIGLGLMGGALAGRLIEACLRHGEGDLDNSVVVREIRRRVRPEGDAPETGG